jgi:hypothetical protein
MAEQHVCTYYGDSDVPDCPGVVNTKESDFVEIQKKTRTKVRLVAHVGCHQKYRSRPQRSSQIRRSGSRLGVTNTILGVTFMS